MNVALLIIDPQNDFYSPQGALFVPGAVEDSKRLSLFIEKYLSEINSINVTLDNHLTYHIAHPIFWRDKDGNHPAPYSEITVKDIDERKFFPYNESLIKKAREYLIALENQGKHNLIIWPSHCVVGSWGHGIDENIRNAIQKWEISYKKNCNYVIKSSNQCTEHFSAIQAEVQDPADTTTRINYDLIDKLTYADKVLVAGEALSHCVSNTIRDLCVYIPTNHITVISDCTSCVKGFEKLGNNFLEEYTKKGMTFIKSTDFTWNN